MAELRKYGLSLLDKPPGLDAQANRDAQARSVKNENLEISKVQRLGRRAYRDAVKNKDFQGAMRAIDFATQRTGSTGAGIGIAGNRERGLTQRNDNLQRQMGILSRPGTQRAESGEAPPSSGASIPVPLGSNPASSLAQRKDLHSRMRAEIQAGRDPNSLRAEATKLGIDDAGWDRGINRIQAPQGASIAPTNVPAIAQAPAAGLPVPGAAAPAEAYGLYQVGVPRPDSQSAGQFAPTADMRNPAGGFAVVGENRPAAPSLADQARALSGIAQISAQHQADLQRPPDTFARLTPAAPNPLASSFGLQPPRPQAVSLFPSQAANPADPLIKALTTPSAAPQAAQAPTAALPVPGQRPISTPTMRRSGPEERRAAQAAENERLAKRRANDSENIKRAEAQKQANLKVPEWIGSGSLAEKLYRALQ